MSKIWLFKTQVPIVEIDVLMKLLQGEPNKKILEFTTGVSSGYYIREYPFKRNQYNLFGAFDRDSDLADSKNNIEVKSIAEFLGILAEYGRNTR